MSTESITEASKQANYQVEIEEDLGSKITMNVGPSHPATHGTLRLIVDTDGENVLGLEQELGFLHTGFEKLGEYHSYNQFITVTDRMNYISPLNNNIGFAIAVEELMGLEVPKKAQWIRVILAELSRIADHIICVGLQGMDLGAFSVFLWTFVERERLYDIFEMVTGARLTTSYTRVGGLAFDIPEDFEERVEKVLEKIESCIKEVDAMLSRNRIFIDRCQGIGILTKESALGYGITGPCLRACGVDYDIRKIRPYSSYEDFDFDVPVESKGDSYARYLVRLEEMRQSICIVRQALKSLASIQTFTGRSEESSKESEKNTLKDLDSEINSFNKKKILPEKNQVYTDMESLIHHFKVIMPGSVHGIQPPVGEVYSSTEVPNGELGFYIISDGQYSAYRMRIRPPSLYNYQCVAELCQGHLIADIPAILSTLNVIAGELDR